MTNPINPIPLKRRKVVPGVYALQTPTGTVIATLAQTGVRGRDNYPWDWYLADGWKVVKNTGVERVTGTGETLAECVDEVTSYWRDGRIRRTEA